MNTTDVTWSRLRQLIKRRDSSKCFHCGIIDENGECDHLVPLAKGGIDSVLNLVWSCSKCNREKGSKLVLDMKEINKEFNTYPNFAKLRRSLITMIVSKIIPPYPVTDDLKLIANLQRQKVRDWIRRQIWDISPQIVDTVNYVSATLTWKDNGQPRFNCPLCAASVLQSYNAWFCLSDKDHQGEIMKLDLTFSLTEKILIKLGKQSLYWNKINSLVQEHIAPNRAIFIYEH